MSALGFSKQPYYTWLQRPYSDSDWDHSHLINAIDVHVDDPEFGYRFIVDELDWAGWDVCENRVLRLCQQERVWSSFTKKACKTKQLGPPVRDDLVDPDFTAERPNQRWVLPLVRSAFVSRSLLIVVTIGRAAITNWNAPSSSAAVRSPALVEIVGATPSALSRSTAMAADT